MSHSRSPSLLSPLSLVACLSKFLFSFISALTLLTVLVHKSVTVIPTLVLSATSVVTAQLVKCARPQPTHVSRYVISIRLDVLCSLFFLEKLSWEWSKEMAQAKGTLLSERCALDL